jgi:glycerophosphoryl diester phosphodiesterase
MEKFKELEVKDKLFIAAHRGASGVLPENTIPAFEQAIADGVDMIEIDIQSTADGLIITYHDLQVCENGESINIQETNYGELPNIIVRDKDIKSIKAPLIKDVFKIIKDRVYLIIEIKEINNRDHKEFIDGLIRIAHEEHVTDQILLSSFYPEYIIYAKSVAPDIPTAAIKIPFKNALPSELCGHTNSEAFICSVDELNDELMNDARQNHIFVGVYSIDDETTLKTALSYKVNAVATNYPKKIVELLHSK